MVIDSVNLKNVIATKEHTVENLIFQSDLKLFKIIIQGHPKTSKQDSCFVFLGPHKTLLNLVGKTKQKKSIFVWQRGLAVLFIDETAGKEAKG